MASTTDFVIRVLEEKLQLSADELSADVALGSSGLDLESIALIELGAHCEEGLGVVIPDEDYGRLPRMTVREFAEYLDARAVAEV
ncbi:acyl carrier protein [Dactylosporangium sp. CA-139114]|uniref:acyl carrier protein n=1 Tax=Dactylosporangium sp. CA-139114 TaxID=3239931 RepID=UPI003D954F18